MGLRIPVKSAKFTVDLKNIKLTISTLVFKKLTHSQRKQLKQSSVSENITHTQVQCSPASVLRLTPICVKIVQVNKNA